MPDLTAKQAQFVNEYMMSLNGTQAAIRAGYSPKTARAIASENLRKPEIAAEIARRRRHLSERFDGLIFRVIEGLCHIAFADYGREFTYLEGWYAISEANRIFGFDGWSRETIESKCVLARENRGTFLAVYVARVRVTVQADGATIIREGHGTGEGRGTSPGEVHDTALKAAETDATKRALATFGRPFGLELYRGGKTAAHKTTAQQTTLPSPSPSPSAISNAVGERVGFHPDDTTPIPRPSHYYGRRHQNPIARHFSDERRQAERTIEPSARTPLSPAPPLAPGAQSEFAPGRIDKSLLTIAEPKRLRDKAHLKFVASQPCLVCGRQPCDPHHLRFAQPRAIGLKVSDEFTVPLCRGHHRQLHQVGNEVPWWENLKIEPLEIAKGLWEKSRAKTNPPAVQSPPL